MQPLELDHVSPAASPSARIARTTAEHLALVAVSLGAAILVAVPLGIFAARWTKLGQVALGLTGVLQTVPSLAMFVFMIPFFGIGWAPAVCIANGNPR